MAITHLDIAGWPVPRGDARQAALDQWIARIDREAALRHGPPSPAERAHAERTLANERALIGRQATHHR